MSRLKPGTVVFFDPNRFNQDWWNSQSETDLRKWYGALGYGKKERRLFVFLCEILNPDGSGSGHCVLVDMKHMRIVSMAHTDEFTAVSEDDFSFAS